ncbi:hypothetical protein FKM82_030914 [Ascaphus truei]
MWRCLRMHLLMKPDAVLKVLLMLIRLSSVFWSLGVSNLLLSTLLACSKARETSLYAYPRIRNFSFISISASSSCDWSLVIRIARRNCEYGKPLFNAPG